MVSVNAPLGASVESPYGEWGQRVGPGRNEQGGTMVKFGRPWDAPRPMYFGGNQRPYKGSSKMAGSLGEACDLLH